MKLICVNNKLGPVFEKIGVLTLNKMYETSGGPPAQYHILCDDNVFRDFSQSRFLTLEEYRDNQINTILE